jgi:hypothetical protein
MTKMQIFKNVHAAMRRHGYERQSWGARGKVYKTIVLPTSVIVKIPGNWSIPKMEEYRIELLNVLEFFKPHVYEGGASVEIYFDEL